MGRVDVTVPNDIVVSTVVYSGEDVWKPQSKGSRTADRQIESFDVDLDRSTLKVARFGPDADPANRLDRSRYILVDIDRVRVPNTDAGISARHREFVTTVMHREIANETVDANGLSTVRKVGAEALENRGFNANYYSASPVVNISCNRAIQEVAPFADISTCYEEFALPELETGVRAFIKNSDLPRWREIRAALAADVVRLVRRN